MASDLVNVLRADRLEKRGGRMAVRKPDAIDLEAADTIERQTAALQAIFDNSTDPVAVEAARAALRSQDKGEG